MKTKIAGLCNILFGGYIGWIAYDCYHQGTLASNQINAMAAIALWIILCGLYYLLKRE